MYEALITLDGWTFLAQICNLMIQLFIFKKLLLEPVRKVIAQRKAKADSQIEDARKLRAEAEAMKAEYEENMRSARAQANEIVANAQKTAAARSEEMLNEARTPGRSPEAEGRGRYRPGAQEGGERGQGRDRRHGHRDRLQSGGAGDQGGRPQSSHRRIYPECG